LSVRAYEAKRVEMTKSLRLRDVRLRAVKWARVNRRQ